MSGDDSIRGLVDTYLEDWRLGDRERMQTICKLLRQHSREGVEEELTTRTATWEEIEGLAELSRSLYGP